MLYKNCTFTTRHKLCCRYVTEKIYEIYKYIFRALNKSLVVLIGLYRFCSVNRQHTAWYFLCIKKVTNMLEKIKESQKDIVVKIWRGTSNN